MRAARSVGDVLVYDEDFDVESQQYALASPATALSAGDRVLAENYLQHADHYHRMMMEENSRREQYQPPRNPQPYDASQEFSTSGEGGMPGPTDTEADVNEQLRSAAGGALPAFLTRQTPIAQPPQNDAQPVVADWEES